LSDQIFADGLSSITVVGGTVRLEFFMFASVEGENGGQPRPVPLHRTVMTTPSFLVFAQKVQEAAAKIAAGTPEPTPIAAAKPSKPRFP
jgi:hypothetical protein